MNAPHLADRFISCLPGPIRLANYWPGIPAILQRPLTWFVLGSLFFGIAVVIVISLSTPYSVLGPVMKFVVYCDPTLEPPNDIIWALTYIWRTLIALFSIGCFCGAIGFGCDGLRRKRLQETG